jgi:hypothetical protein
VTKLNSSGSTLVYSTYLGASSNESAVDIAVDSTGNAYIAGGTGSADFPTTPGAFRTSLAGGPGDVFVTKLNPSGSSLIFSTFLGGSVGHDLAFGIAVDATDSIYVTGFTRSTDFPTTPNAFSPNTSEGFCSQHAPPTPCQNAFVTKLNTEGSALVYSTYLGGSDSDEGSGIAVDASGNAYVTGETISSDFPTANPVQAVKGSSIDVFVTKLNPMGSALIYSTFLGGNFAQQARAIAVDTDGAAYITGLTASLAPSDFPTTPDALLADPTQGHAFMTKLSATGILIYSTLIPGTGLGLAIGVDAAGNTYVTGKTMETNLPTTPGAFQLTRQGEEDAFVVKFGEPSPVEITENLITDIETLVAMDVLNQGQGNALTAKLRAAIKKMEQGNVNTAINQLQAFINQVNALINGGTLTPAEGQPLLDAANNIINALQVQASAASDELIQADQVFLPIVQRN